VRLAQVFANLLNNAAKYTPAPGRIALRARCVGDEVVVAVEDDGIGLSPALRARVFEMFTQGDHAQAQGGLGIGLTLARTLVELHGGTVEARSDGPDRGSTFVVRLPVDATHTGEVAEEARDPAPPRRRQSVLVVDDNPESADSLAMLLRLAGDDVRTVYDGEACLAEITRHAPDVVLLDLGMPGVDGYEVCRRIRALAGGGRIAVLATSGWGQQVDRMRSQESGFDAHFVKPVDPVALQVEMERASRARR
jgi:CheY-like chemotaxis protein